MKIGDLVRINSVYSWEHQKYLGKIGVLRRKATGTYDVWLVFIDGKTLLWTEDRLEVINEDR